MNPLRKLIQKTGFDFHRYRKDTDKYRYFRLLNIKTILDIGANTGQFAKEAREKLPQAKIISFEPLKGCFEKLNEKMRSDKNFTSFNFALGDKDESKNMNKSEYSPSSSILEMSDAHKNLFPHTKIHKTESIDIKKLDSIAPQLDLKKEILIKVDVQGFEDKVIAGGETTFKEARVILLENSFVELYRGQPTFDVIYKKLKFLGFEYKGSMQEKIDKHTGKIISEDSIFVK
jgi:FkbM family methyltransferase